MSFGPDLVANILLHEPYVLWSHLGHDGYMPRGLEFATFVPDHHATGLGVALRAIAE